MRVGILGINHKLAHLKLRESLAQICQRRFGAGNSTHGQRHHFVLLSTCNRTEIYFTSESLADTHTYILNILRQEVDENFDQKLYSYFGSDCFLHLCRVTTGLDSAIVGETEIQGQVKNAYEYASKYISLPGQLHYLFQKALTIGKKVRSHLPLQRGLPDLEHAILNAGTQAFNEVKAAKVLFVGASEINRKILTFFKGKNFEHLTLCNRSGGVAEKLAIDYGVSVLEWKKIGCWHTFDWIIFGTKASGYLVDGKSISTARTSSRKLIIDLSVPRNVDPEVSSHPDCTLLNIDEINQSLHMRHQQMAHVLNEAEALISHFTCLQVDLKMRADNRKLRLCR